MGSLSVVVNSTIYTPYPRNAPDASPTPRVTPLNRKVRHQRDFFSGTLFLDKFIPMRGSTSKFVGVPYIWAGGKSVRAFSSITAFHVLDAVSGAQDCLQKAFRGPERYQSRLRRLREQQCKEQQSNHSKK